MSGIYVRRSKAGALTGQELESKMLEILQRRVDGTPLSQDDCALLLGLSHARIGQIEQQAIKKLRRAASRRGLSR